MSAFELNKIIGAIVLVLIVSTVVGMIGDALVKPGAHKARVTVVAVKAPAAAARRTAKARKSEPIASLLASADAAAGNKIARKCVGCHTLKKDGAAKIGPNLWNIVGAAKARSAGFGYSSAMRSKGGKWTYEDLSAFLESPRAYLKGTKMSFAGVKKARDRANLIAFLRSLSASPAPLPRAVPGRRGSP